MRRIYGIETEYGITVEGVTNVDVVAESMAIVRSYSRIDKARRDALMKWDYELEDPHRDARGFRVRELLQDTDELNLAVKDQERNLSYYEIKSDLVLSNGARFYNDHAHPEYTTPECGTLFELIAQDKAGERILAECIALRNDELKDKGKVKLFKNNTDFEGHSYGCHENYLMERKVSFEKIVEIITPFLITRQIYAGAGKMGIETEGATSKKSQFQISQRSDFLSVLVSIDTMNRRPIINTRDEPHADPSQFRRLHIIIGDANMSEYASALKIGTVGLLCDLMELGAINKVPAIANPVEAIQKLSHDANYRWNVAMQSGGTMPAIEIQRHYLKLAQKYLRDRNKETNWLLEEWELTLNDLEKDPMLCVDRLDWVAKKWLLEMFRENEKLDWDDPWLKSLDLEYHNINPEEGLYYELLREGKIRRVVDDYWIKRAMLHPPRDTRAYFRGRCVDRFAQQMSAIQWDEVVFGFNGEHRVISLLNVFDEETIRRYNVAVDTSRNVGDLINILKPSEEEIK